MNDISLSKDVTKIFPKCYTILEKGYMIHTFRGGIVWLAEFILSQYLIQDTLEQKQQKIVYKEAEKCVKKICLKNI